MPCWVPLPISCCPYLSCRWRWLDFELSASAFLCLRSFSSHWSLLVGCHQVISTREWMLPSTSGKLCMYLLHRLLSLPAGFCSEGPQWYLLDKLFIAASFPSLSHVPTPLLVFPEITPQINYVQILFSGSALEEAKLKYPILQKTKKQDKNIVKKTQSLQDVAEGSSAHSL